MSPDVLSSPQTSWPMHSTADLPPLVPIQAQVPDLSILPRPGTALPTPDQAFPCPTEQNSFPVDEGRGKRGSSPQSLCFQHFEFPFQCHFNLSARERRGERLGIKLPIWSHVAWDLAVAKQHHPRIHFFGW